MEIFAKYKKVVLFHILTQKTLISVGVNCAFIYNYYSNRTYMYGYCSTCINILVTFFLFLSLSLSLLLSPHSPSRLPLCDQHHTTTARRTPSFNITPLPLISIKPHAAWSNRRQSLSPQSPFFSFDQDQTIVTDELVDQDQTTTVDQHQTTATQSLIKSPSVNSLISHCLISGFRVGWVMIWLSN